ncbi:MAG: hypothetical protein GX805_10915, partial [Gammaproteobacteria bacterium]|nr:hypothetical protein [Gammaproteobacteria bacterium]
MKTPFPGRNGLCFTYLRPCLQDKQAVPMRPISTLLTLVAAAAFGGMAATALHHGLQPPAQAGPATQAQLLP